MNNRPVIPSSPNGCGKANPLSMRPGGPVCALDCSILREPVPYDLGRYADSLCGEQCVSRQCSQLLSLFKTCCVSIRVRCYTDMYLYARHALGQIVQ